MECNKDEALRAKELAEKKMQSNDFLGAQKIALKAERIYPQLENISQLLAVCNVHCSAQTSTLGPEKDWYGILQIDMMADEVTIKKQYRRLALVLHPDKNKFPGAEAAFKLIGEANMVLSDRTKRASYDSRYRVLSKSTAAKRPSHQVNRNPPVRQQNIPNGVNTQFNNLNHQQTQPTSSATFWTGCPFCNVRFQYYRSFVNRALRCQKCSKPFIAYDLGFQGAPLGPKWSHPGGQDVPPSSNMSQPHQQKEVPHQGTSGMAAEGVGFAPSPMESQQGPSSRTTESQPEVRRGKTAQLFEDMKAKGKEMGGMKEAAAKPKVNKKNRKRGRKQTVESSESIDTSSSTEPEVVDIESGNYPPAGEGFGYDSFGPRRSSRLRQHVSYNEGASDDDKNLASPPKKVRPNHSAGGNTSEQKEALSGDDSVHTNPKEALSGDDSVHTNPTGSLGNSKAKATQNGTSPPKANVQDKSANIRKVDKQAAGAPSSGVEAVEVVDSDSEPDSEPCDDPPESYDCPDPEFNNFDKHKEESCFAVDQIWACYDTADGMPRFYCLIRKVLSPKFELRFNWLEAVPEGQGDMEKWVEAGLPAGCGKFRREGPQETAGPLTFSHPVQYEKGKRGQFIVYPRKGEVWALFKDWDIGWSSDPENHRKYKYEIVEVLCDFGGDVGIKVNYLDKVSGFVSLFKSTSQGSFFVKPNELCKFSHRIPSFRMTGTEKEGVPVGSFELDPAALPLNPVDLWYPGKVNEDSRSAKSKSVMSEKTIPKKSVDLKGMGATDAESSKVRRSPRGVNISMTRKL